MRGPMHARVDALAPGVCLAIEIIEIGKADPCPQRLLDVAHGALHFALGLSRQLHHLPLSQKEFSPSLTPFIPCMVSSLRSSATGTIGENIASPFTIPLATCEGCQQPGRALLPLIPVSSLPPVEPPFAWLICSSFPSSSDASKRDGRRRQSVKPITPEMSRKLRRNTLSYISISTQKERAFSQSMVHF